MLLPVIVEDELLVQVAHVGVIDELEKFHFSILLVLNHPFQNHLAYVYQHFVVLIIAVVLDSPVDNIQRELGDILKVEQQFAQLLLLLSLIALKKLLSVR